MKILVVDDDTVFVDTMRKILTLNKHVVTTAYSAEEALGKADEAGSDLIFTDLKMPKVSGVELIKKIREKGIESIIIVITGYGSIESAIEAMKYGAYDYFQKPFEKSKLLNIIKEVETELKLRSDLAVSNIEEESKTEKKLELFDIKGYKSPFLLISDKNPHKIISKLNLHDVTPIWLTYENVEDSITPTKLHFLKSKIENFVKQNENGTILFKGINMLLKTHHWENLKKFIIYLYSEIITSNFTLVILFEENIESLEKTQQSLFYDAISIFINPIFNKIINILSHSLQKDIINLLKTKKKLTYNNVMGKLEVSRSSVLTFHLSKLLEEGIIEKEKNAYLLSQKGRYFAEIILQIENLGFSVPQSQIKIIKM